MLRAVTESVVPSTRYDPTTTSAAPTSCPTLMIVARLSDPDTGKYSCSNARTRCDLTIAPGPLVRKPSVRSTAAASLSQ